MSCECELVLGAGVSTAGAPLSEVAIKNEIGVLYGAAKIIANELRSPQTKSLPVYDKDGSISLSETVFDSLYMEKVVDEEHILGWYDDVDDET